MYAKGNRSEPNKTGATRTSELSDVGVEIVGRLWVRRSEVVQAIDASIRGEEFDRTGIDDPEYTEGLREAVRAAVDYVLTGIGRPEGLSESVPHAVMVQAGRAARIGVSLGTVLRRYIAGHRLLGEFVAEEAERIGLDSNGSALHYLRRTQEALLERIAAAIEREYLQEFEQVGRSRHRLEVVKTLLCGDSVGPADMAALDYELDAFWHLGLIVSGPRAHDAIRGSNVRSGHKLLRVSCDKETMWAWIGGPGKLADADLQRVLPATLADVALAVGEPARGVEGWRQTHRSARMAHLVAQCRRCGGLTRYWDVALEATALHDEVLAQVLVERYLSPLDDGRGGGSVRRRTLRAIFEAEHNVSSAASKLGVDRSTVRRRLEDVERRLGYRLHEHRPEIEIALRIEELREGFHTDGSADTAARARGSKK